MSMPDPRQYRIVAVVANSEVQQLIRSALLRSQWEVEFVPSLPAALELLPLSDAAVVICCQEAAGDQSWRRMAGVLSHLARPPFLVVASRLADDDLWQDVLTGGGYDVLSLPFDKRDLFRVLSLAGSYWRARRATPVLMHEHAVA